MTPTSDPIISSLGKKAAEFFRVYRIAGLKAVEDAARDHDDVIDIYATQSAEWVAGSWNSKFGHREARLAIYRVAAVIAVFLLIALNAWGMWLAYSHFGFSTIGSGVATAACIGILGSFALILAFLLAVESYQVPCEACLAVSLWTRGWTPVSMEWFGADSGATWALGAKNLYVWQKPFHGWGNPELRVIRYDSVKLIADPMASRNFVYLSLDFDLPQPRTEWIRFPVSSNGTDGEQLAGEIVARASLRGKDVQLLKPQKEEHREEQGDVFTLSPRVQPRSSCWKLIH